MNERKSKKRANVNQNAPSGPPVNCAYDELVPNPRNPNQHPASQVALLAKVIAHQGWRSHIIASGHGRYEAVKVLGHHD